MTPAEIKGVIDNSASETRAIYEVALQLAELNAKLTPDWMHGFIRALDEKEQADADERRRPR